VEKYRQLRREEKRIHRYHKRQFENSLVGETEHFRLQNESRKLYQCVHHTGQAFIPRSNTCKNTNGTTLTNREQMLGRWVEHFKTLLEGENVEEAQDEELNRQVEQEQGSGCDAENCKPPTEEEMLKAIHKLNDNKSPGRDGIPADIIKSAGTTLIHYLHELMVDVWTTEKMSQEWNIGLICPINKKGDRLECRNYRGITLLNAANKIFTNILNERLKPWAEKTLHNYRCGF
jgi:hypothetical protein